MRVVKGKKGIFFQGKYPKNELSEKLKFSSETLVFYGEAQIKLLNLINMRMVA